MLDAFLQVAQLVFSVFPLREKVDQIEHLSLVYLLIERQEQVANIRSIDSQLVRAVWILIFLIVEIKRETFIDYESCDVDVFCHIRQAV